jgi:hypothetical protein
VHAGFRETSPFRAFTDQVIVRPGLVGFMEVHGHPAELAFAVDLDGRARTPNADLRICDTLLRRTTAGLDHG